MDVQGTGSASPHDPGIGVLNATALIAAIGHGKSFARDGTWRFGSAWCRGR
jgi:hypothetical protein